MLQIEKRPMTLSEPEISGSEPEISRSVALGERLEFVMAVLRRRYLSILISVVICLGCGALYLFLSPAIYTASTTMMIETRRGQLLQPLLGDAPPDSAWIESQIGVLKSYSVAAYVVKQLRLADDSSGFIGSVEDVGLVDKLRRRLGWVEDEPPQSESERVGTAIGAVSSQLDVRRMGMSYLIRINFQSRNPDIASKIANAVVDAYIFDQLNAKYQANRRGGDWLQERLQALREQAATAERAVLEFKVKNNIVAAGGRLLNDTQLGDLNTRIVAARTQTAEVEARLNRIDTILKADESGPMDESITEALSNPIITKLRTQYLDLVNREADWSVRYGKNHNAVTNIRRQIREARNSILDELKRIRQAANSEYEIAKQRQDELEKRLAGIVSQSQETNQAQVALFNLEASAQSYRKLYDNFLQRHTESVQTQSLPMTEARLVSPASVGKTHPRPMFVWMMALFSGGMLGAGLATLREIRDRGFRTREQVRSELGLDCMALVPKLTESSWKTFYRNQQVTGPHRAKAKSLVSYGDGGVRPAAKGIRPAAKMVRHIIEEPSSPFANSIRSIKLCLELNDQETSNKVVGISSCVAGEGKSTIAASLAALFGKSGANVILVDCDLRNPTLSRALAPAARRGLLDVVVGDLPFSEAVCRDPDTGMDFLPNITHPLHPDPIDILTSNAMKSLFVALEVKYDYVIVDLPPLVAVGDMRAMSRLVDAYILVIEWGRTKIDAVRYALRNTPGVRNGITGAVLNKVDIGGMQRYDNYGAQYYYGRSDYAARTKN